MVFYLMQKYDLNRLSRQLLILQVYFSVGHVFFLYNCKPPLHKHTDDMVFLILFMCRGGGLRPSLRQSFDLNTLNGVKSCNSRQEKLS